MKFRDVEKILSREGIPCHTYEQKEYDSSYTIEKSIGIGGWAEIFLVKPKENNTKVVHKNFKQNSPNLKHFSLDIQIQMQLKEIRALYKLKHLDCIVKLHKAIVIKSEENIEKLIIEEEYVEGNTLNKIELQSEEEKIKIAREIIKSIFCVHEQELIHRDLSRGNFMVAAQNLVKVIDFGAVKLDTDDQFLPIPKGTEGTLSPEGYWNNIIINRLNANNVSLEELTLLKKFKDTITQNLQDYEDASSIVPEEAIQDWHKQRIPWGKKCDIFSLGVILGQLFFGIDSLKFSSTINKKDIKLGWQEINFDFLLGDYELTIISQAGKNEFLLKLLKKMCSYKPKDRPDIKKVKEEFDKIYPQDSINNAANAGRTFKILNLWKNILLPSSPVKDIFNLKQKEIALSFDLGASSLKLAYKLGKKEHPVPFFLDYRIKTLVFSQKAKDFLEFNYLNTIPTVFYMKNDGTLVVADQAIADFVDNNDLIVDKNLKLSLLNNAGDKKIETHNNPDNICYKDVLKAILEYSKTFIDQLLSKKGYSLKYIVFSYPIYGEKYKEYCILFRNILNELFPLGFENIYEIDEASATLAHLLKYPEKIKKIYKNTTLALSMGSLSFEGALLEPDINDENVETECVYHHYSFNEDKIVGGDKCTKIIKEFLETEFHELENKILAAEIIKQNLSDQYARAMGDSATWNVVDGEILYKLSYAGKEVDIPLRAFTKMNAFCDSKRALEAKLNEIYQEKPFQNIYLVGGAATDFSYLKALNSFLLSKMPVVINIVRPHALRHAVCMGNLLYNEMKKSHIARELPVNLHLLVMESSDKIYIKNIFKKFQLEGGMEETYITCQKAILFYGDYKENSSWYPIKEYKINNNLTKLTFRWGNDERYGISLSITEKNITSGIVQKSVICLANLFWKDNSNRDSLFQAKKMLDLYQKYYLGINKVNLMFLIDNTPSMQEEDIDLKESKIDLVLEIFYNIIGNYDKLQIAYALYGDYPGYEEDTSQYILYLSQESDLNNTEKTLATLLESPLLKKIKDKQPLSPFFVYSDKEDLIKQIRKNVKEFKVEGFDKEEALFSALLMCTLVQYLPGVTIIIIMTDSRYHVENSPNYSNEQEYLKKYYKKEIDIQLRDILKQFMQSNPNVVFFCIPLSESTDVRGALEDIMYYNAAIFKKNPLFKNLFGIDVDKTTIISNLKNAITAAQTLNPSRLPEELVNYISDLNL